VTLKEQLDAYQAKARAKRPPEVQAIMDRETDNLRRSGIADGRTPEDARVLRFFAETLGVELRSHAGSP